MAAIVYVLTMEKVHSLGKHLLIIEDDVAFGKTLALEFNERGYVSLHIDRPEGLEETISQCQTFDFAIVDLRLKTTIGTELLNVIQLHSPNCRILILTGYPTIATCVRAFKKGAINYLIKPASVELIEQALWIDDVDGKFDLETSDNARLTLDQHEREYIEFVLFQTQNNVTHAAERLGIHRQSLQRKLRKNPPR